MSPSAIPHNTKHLLKDNIGTMLWHDDDPEPE